MTRPIVPLGLHTVPGQPEPKPKPEPKALAGAAQAQAAQAPSTEPIAGRPATAEPASSGQLPCDVTPLRPLLMAGTCPEAPVGGPHPEPKASAGITAALAQALAAPLKPPGSCLSWVMVTDPQPFGTGTTVSMHILHVSEIVGTTRSEAEALP
jgi:hypothetical protein